MAQRKNTLVPDTKQIWAHIRTGVRLLIVDISKEFAYCRILDGPKLTKAKVAVPLCKFKDYGNRGFRYDLNRKGVLPAFGKVTDYGAYTPRNINFGA